MKVYHYTDKANLDSIMHSGLKTTSRYESFTELRKDVVFCWLSPSDNKIFSEDTICLEITADENDCIVASMDYISFAMMYKYGGAKYGGINIPINERAYSLNTRRRLLKAAGFDLPAVYGERTFLPPLPDESGMTEVTCCFCDQVYRFTREELENPESCARE